MIRYLIILCVMNAFIVLIGCGTKETLAEVEFEKSRFGLEYIPDRSLEGYNEKYHPYFQSQASSEKKYLLMNDGGFMFANFPKDPSLLKGIEVIIIDTVARTYEKYDRTEALTTLYIDPKVIDQSSWLTFSHFVNQCYSKPDSANQLLRWLNYKYNLGNTPDSLYVFNTIYALVYTDVASLEPVYARSDGKRFIKVGVDKGIYFKDDSEEFPAWLYTGRLTDSVFHYWTGRAALAPEFGDYAKDGAKFKSLYKGMEEEY